MCSPQHVSGEVRQGLLSPEHDLQRSKARRADCDLLARIVHAIARWSGRLGRRTCPSGLKPLNSKILLEWCIDAGPRCLRIIIAPCLLSCFAAPSPHKSYHVSFSSTTCGLRPSPGLLAECLSKFSSTIRSRLSRSRNSYTSCSLMKGIASEHLKPCHLSTMPNESALTSAPSHPLAQSRDMRTAHFSSTLF